MPAVLFPHPGVNEALELSALGPLVYIVTLIGSGLSVVVVRRLAWKAEMRVGLAVFLLGLVPAFVLAIVTFGNFSNDRFAPLYLTPLLALPVGIAILIAAIGMSSRSAGGMLKGAVRGAVPAIVVALWIQIRGARDWLQAPYGFDLYMLIAVAAASVCFLGVTSHDSRPVRTLRDDRL